MNSTSNDDGKAEIEDRGPWFAKGLAFECTQCGNCCSGPGTGFVWISEAEISAIATQIGMESDIDGFERKFTRRIGARVSLVEYSDGDCIFLDPKSRNCSVYGVRPVQCRTWPFWDSNVVTPKAWGEAAKSCPGCNHGKLYSLVEIEKSLKTDKLGAGNIE